LNRWLNRKDEEIAEHQAQMKDVFGARVHVAEGEL
jgi:hypothetical protein